MDKYYNDKGEVAVLVCPRFGAGWSTWNSGKEKIFDPVLVKAVLDNATPKELETIAKERYPDAYLGGVGDGLSVEWVKPGEKFYIHEYDGSEHIVREEDFETA